MLGIKFLSLQKVKLEIGEIKTRLERIENESKQQKIIEIQIKEVWPYAMNWVAKKVQETHGQREMNLSHLREFFIEHFESDFTKVNEEALKMCWEKIQELDGVSYDKERNIYILRRW